MLIYSVVSYVGVKRRVSMATLLCDNVFETDEIGSPFVCGFLRPKIYLPVGINDTEREYVLRHERTHIERLDHIIKPFAFLVLSVHWFNPFMWLAFWLMSQDMEMSCDKHVISEFDHEGKAEYSMALVNLAMKRTILAGSPLAFGESGTKGRVKNVLNYKRPSFWIVCAAVIAVVVAAVCLLTNPVKTLKLPDKNTVLSMEIEQFNERESLGSIKVVDGGNIEIVMSALSGGKKALRQSTNDYPTQSNYLIVRLVLEGEQRTLYLYSEGGSYYIEEPYVGVYESDRAASVAIHKIYTEIH